MISSFSLFFQLYLLIFPQWAHTLHDCFQWARHWSRHYRKIIIQQPYVVKFSTLQIRILRHRDQPFILLANKSVTLYINSGSNWKYIYHTWWVAQVKGKVPNKTALTSDTSHRVRGPQAICTLDPLAANLGGSRNTPQIRYFTKTTHRTEDSTTLSITALLWRDLYTNQD